MKRYNKVYLLMALLGGASCIDASSAAINTIRVLRAIAVNAPATKPSAVPAVAPASSVPAAIVPPTAPVQPLSAVAVSETAGLANFGTTTPIKLDYQVEQLPVTAQMHTLSMVASFGSTQSSSFTFDATTLTVLNTTLAAGHAVVVQVGTTSVDGNIVAYAGLFNESNMSAMFGYAIQEAPAGVTEAGLTGFTITYQLATATTTNTIDLTADQSLFILNPTISLVSPLSAVSVQAVFGSSDKPVVSAPITFDAATVQAIQAALTAGHIVTFSVVAEYMFGLGDMVAFAVDLTSGSIIGDRANLAITPAQEQAGNFIAYVANLSMTGQAGQASYVRGINQDLQLQVPAVASTAVDFYVPADLSVAIPEGQSFPNVTINGIFSDGSSSSGFVFAPQYLTQIDQVLALGHNVSIIVQQSSNGATLMASAVDVEQMQVAVMTTNQVTPAQAKETLTGFALTYQLSGQAKPTVLQAQLGQAVTFGTSVYFTLAVDPTTIAQSQQLDTRGFFLQAQGGNVTRGLRFAPADFTKIQAALTAGHPVVIGTGYSAEQQQMVMQAYDNVAKVVIAQVQQASNNAAKEPLFGFICDYNPGPNPQTGQMIGRPAKILVPAGNVLTLVPVTMTVPAVTAVQGSVISCPSRQKPLQSIQIQPNFGASTASEWIALTDRDARRVDGAAHGGVALFTATYQNNYFVLSVWDLNRQRELITPIAIPITGGTFSGFTVAYNYPGDTSFAPVNTVSVSAGQGLSLIVAREAELRSPTAAQSLTLPSAATPVSQLWFSPVFNSGNFSELPLQAAPELMTALNAVLAQNQEVMFAHNVVPTSYSQTVQGYDLICTAWNMANTQQPVELFTYLFPLIPGTNGQPILQNDPWNRTNITYQFGSAPTVILAGLQPQNPTFSISSQVNVSGPLSLILPQLEPTYPDITQFYTGQPVVAYSYTTTLTAIDMYLGAAGAWATYVDLETNLGGLGQAVANGQGLQEFTPAQWSEGVLILPVLFNFSGCNTQSGFIMDPTSVGGGCTATCYLVFASLDGKTLVTMPTAGDNTVNSDCSELAIALNQGYPNSQWIHLKYGQPVLLQLTGNPPVGA